MKVVATEKAPKALGPYSQGYVHNGIFIQQGRFQSILRQTLWRQQILQDRQSRCARTLQLCWKQLELHLTKF